MAAQVILLQAQPRQASDGTAQTVRLAGGGAAVPYRYFGQDWKAGVVALPTFICGLDFSGTDLGTGGIPQATEIEWCGARQADVATLAALFWPDAPVSIYIGPEGADPPLMLQGKALAVTVEDGKLKISLADPAADLKKPLLVDRYAGTGGLEGPVEWTGTIKRRAFGRIWNLKGDPIDKANNIYAFANPTKPLQAITAIRDKGAAAASLTTVAWAGSAGATLTALQAASAPSGGGVVCPSIACVKWWTQPAGDLCADLQGEIGSAYVETAAEIVQRLVQSISGPAFASGTISAAAGWRSAPIGYLAKDENETVAAMLDKLLGDSSLLWALDGSGQIVLRQWAWGMSAVSVRSHDVSRKASYKPVVTRRVGYRHNEDVMARGDIASIVLSTDVAYLDGTPIESLKPAAAGATVGAPVGTTVAGRDAADVASTIKAGGGVAASQVDTAAIQAAAVTDTGQAINSSVITGSVISTFVTLASFTITMPVAGEIIAWSTVRQAFASGAKQWAMQLLIDGTVVFDHGGSAIAEAVTMAGKAAVGAGARVVSVRAAAQDSTVTIPTGGASLVALRRVR